MLYAIKHTDLGLWWDGSRWVESRSSAKWLNKTEAKRAINKLRKEREPFPADTVRLVSLVN